MSNDAPQTFPPENFGRLREIPIQARLIDTANLRGLKIYEELAAGLLQHIMEQEALLSTKGQVRDCLREYRRRIERRREWLIPFSFAVAFFSALATIHTGNFPTTLMGFSQGELRGAFYVLTALATVSTGWTAFRGWTSSDISVERVINDMDYRKS